MSEALGALGAGLIPIAAIGSQKGCEVAVSWVQGDTVIPMPAV